MATIPPTPQIPRPGNYGHNNPDFAFLDANELRGFQIVDSIAGRDTISADKRSLGCQANISTTGKSYIYIGADLSNPAWTALANWVSKDGILVASNTLELTTILATDTDEELIVLMAEDITIPSTTIVTARNITLIGNGVLTLQGTTGGFVLLVSGTSEDVVIDTLSPIKFVDVVTSFALVGGDGTLSMNSRYIFSDDYVEIEFSGGTFEYNQSKNIVFSSVLAGTLSKTSDHGPTTLLKETAYTGTPVFNMTEANIHEFSLEGIATLAVTNIDPGNKYEIYVKTDAIGGYAITAGASMGTIRDGDTPIASATANALYIYTVEKTPSGIVFYTIESVGN